jgi:hypothetical protein
MSFIVTATRPDHRRGGAGRGGSLEKECKTNMFEVFLPHCLHLYLLFMYTSRANVGFVSSTSQILSLGERVSKAYSKLLSLMRALVVSSTIQMLCILV